jgi:serine/threonine protein kinase
MFGRPISEIGNIFRIPRHPNIVKYYGWFQFDSYAVVGMELCAGDLMSYLAQPPYSQYSPEQERYTRWYILQQIAEGLHQCHLSQMIHRDIKPQNSSHHFGSLLIDSSIFARSNDGSTHLQTRRLRDRPSGSVTRTIGNHASW